MNSLICILEEANFNFRYVMIKIFLEKNDQSLSKQWKPAECGDDLGLHFLSATLYGYPD